MQGTHALFRSKKDSGQLRLPQIQLPRSVSLCRNIVPVSIEVDRIRVPGLYENVQESRSYLKDWPTSSLVDRLLFFHTLPTRLGLRP
jgi:hypothetical protein